ncbi:hypothetical protein HRG_005691 [Hirsutella rhossiliensis]|uniref:Uncharacterized protein n=1 Tax=Hirsutella rhossiliensis TaxID=111463 RepID=A0A9P8SHV1_9HYPO|nr:uncharacterized protein HRG_05691 [Hirsutella rhossiliensis]KAH0963181.1 hypothetical protein HRG_05691 [Hirsutella rhossiliensis]
MGFFSDGLSKRRSRSSSPSRPRSRSSSRRRRSGLGSGAAPFAAPFFADSGYHKHNASRGSFFGLGNSSRSSFFGLGGSSRPSYYKRSPRHGFLQRAYRQLRRLLRDLVHYAKRHPWKVFFLVVMPLVTGGALTALLARFGLRMPPSLERMLGVASRAAAGDGFGLVSDAVRMAGDGFASPRARDGPDLHWERRTSAYSSAPSRPRDDGWGESIKGVAKMFL